MFVTYINILLLIRFLYNDHFLNMRNKILILKINKGKIFMDVIKITILKQKTFKAYKKKINNKGYIEI